MTRTPKDDRVCIRISVDSELPQVCSRERAEGMIRSTYVDPDPVLKQFEKGVEIRTPFAWYSLRALMLAICICFASTSSGAIIERGLLNIIDDPGNPSDGLAYLDVGFFLGASGSDVSAGLHFAGYPNGRKASAIP